MRRKGRREGAYVRGEGHPQAKLSDSLVHLIRNSDESAKELARELGVHFSQVYRVRSRERWKHV